MYKPEYIKAKESIKKYEQEISKHYVTPKTCCICEVNSVEPIETAIIDPLKQEKGMWNSGVVERLSCGYGSKHDLNSYYIAICDDCISNLIENRLAVDFKELSKQVKDKLH